MTVLGRRVDVQTRANTIFGMAIVAFATSLVCASGAVAQYNGGSLMQLMLGSYAIQNIMAWAWWCVRKPRQATHWFGDSPHKCNIWTRGVLYWIMMFTWWKGLEMVPIGDAEAILFVSPMVTIFLGRVWLKEELPRMFPLTIIITALGLIFVCQPDFIFNYTATKYEQVSWPGMIFLVVCIATWAATSLLVRTAKEAHWLQVNIVTSFQSAWIWTPIFAILNHFIGNNLGEGNGDPASNSDNNIAWIDGADLTDWDWSAPTLLAIVAMAFFEFFGVTCKVVGYQLGEATKVASMEYLTIVFAFGFQWLMFHRTPNVWEFSGAGLLILTCVIHLLEEKYWPRSEKEPTDTHELESFMSEGDEDETALLTKYGIKEGARYGTDTTNWVRMDGTLLRESSHMHINFDGAYDVDSYKDVTKDWPRIEDRNTSY